MRAQNCTTTKATKHKAKKRLASVCLKRASLFNDSRLSHIIDSIINSKESSIHTLSLAFVNKTSVIRLALAQTFPMHCAQTRTQNKHHGGFRSASNEPARLTQLCDALPALGTLWGAVWIGCRDRCRSDTVVLVRLIR